MTPTIADLQTCRPADLPTWTGPAWASLADRGPRGYSLGPAGHHCRLPGRTAVTTQETQPNEAILLPSTPAHASATTSFERFLDMVCTATDPTSASRTGSARV